MCCFPFSNPIVCVHLWLSSKVVCTCSKVEIMQSNFVITIRGAAADGRALFSVTVVPCRSRTHTLSSVSATDFGLFREYTLIISLSPLLYCMSITIYYIFDLNQYMEIGYAVLSPCAQILQEKMERILILVCAAQSPVHVLQTVLPLL